VPRASSWTLADLLDFEVLLAADAARDEAVVRARDRTIFAETIAPILGESAASDHRSVFRLWLDARRETEKELPGGRFEAGRQALLSAAAIAGLVTGASVATALLHYRGEEPVNVAWFFAATVGIQWLVLAASLTFWIVRRLAGSGAGPLRTLVWTLGAGLRRLSGEKRESLRELLATIEQRREIYGSVAVWPPIVVTQLFGVCFNLGILATLVAHVALSDVGFGWQSTLSAGPEQAHRLVSAAAIPWSFLPNAHPTLEQVVGSRFSYSQGIAPLSREAMASWWPFLFYSVLFYGLLVRAVLLAWAVVASRAALGALGFDHQACNALYRRLTGPVVFAAPDGAALASPAIGADTHEPGRATGRCAVLVAEGLTASDAFLSRAMPSQLGCEVAVVLAFEIDHPSGNEAVLETLARDLSGLSSVVVAVPAQRSPIKAISLCLEKVAAAAGKAETVVVLFGRPDGGGFAPVSDEELAHWRRFIAIHRLHLGLERWRPS
jgi:hypothetical protein